METRAHHVVVGAFVLGILALIFVAVIWLARGQIDREFALYDIYFTGSVTGLNKGATVSYSGVQIGRVEDISLDPKNVERVRVTIQADPNIPIKEDAVASLEPQGITGYAFVQITGGTRNAQPVQKKEGERHPVIQSRPSTLEAVFQATPQILEKTKVIADQLAKVFSDDNREALTETIQNMRNATAAVGGTGGDINGILVEASATMKELRQAIATANRTLGSIDKVVSGKEGLMDKVDTAMNDFSSAAKRASDVAQRVEQIVQESRPGLRDFSQRTLPDVNQLVADLRHLTQALTRVAAEIERDPPRFFFGDRREGYRPR
jgi:phospholipid/cholesterol/gamma-HCH transport system substrate-binding protein